MTEGTIPEDVRRFLLVSIGSVPHLEAILMLRAQPGSPWTAQSVAARLYIPEKAAADILVELHEAGILARSDSTPAEFGYQPASEDLRRIIDATAAAYARDLVGVSDLIHSKTGRKAQAFADAFKIRKEP